MTLLELGNKLKEMYETEGANKSTMIHLFGIIYGDEMRNAGVKPIDVVKAAQMQESYQTEVNKGMNLSKYVELKAVYKNKF
ncbi:MAG: hypothetical protein GX625_19550 [Clostridiaceae bacterium]|jgi:hypothetical protein|nr:hypothetical protein [Desulfitobacteriaceae bacterium]NLE27485.1 hypothetical protein [Clostridiaceae bacterium]